MGIYDNYIVAEKMARERESGTLTEIFNKVLIPSYNWDNPAVQWVAEWSIHGQILWTTHMGRQLKVVGIMQLARSPTTDGTD